MFIVINDEIIEVEYFGLYNSTTLRVIDKNKTHRDFAINSLELRVKARELEYKEAV